MEDLFHPFLFYGVRMDWFLYFLVFVAGIITSMLWSTLVETGRSVMLFRYTHDECLRLLSISIQSIEDAKNLKYLILEKSATDQRFLEIEKNIDENNYYSMKNTVIRNFINEFPQKYEFMIEYSNWEEAMAHLTKILKKHKTP